MSEPYKNYREIGRISVGGKPMDLTTYNYKVYVANYTQDMSVISTISSTIVGNIPTGSGCVSIGIDESHKYAYVLNSFDNSVKVIDLNTDTIVNSVAIASGASKLVVDNLDHEISIINPSNQTLTKIKELNNIWFIQSIETLAKTPTDITINKNTGNTFIVYVPFDSQLNPILNDSPITKIDRSENKTNISNTKNVKISSINNNQLFVAKLPNKNSNETLNTEINILDNNGNVINTYSNISNLVNYQDVEYNSLENNIFIISSLENQIVVLDSDLSQANPFTVSAFSVGSNPQNVAFAMGLIPSATPTITPTNTVTPTITSTLTPTPTPTIP